MTGNLDDFSSVDHELDEGTTPRITYELRDGANAKITAALDSQTVTIYDLKTGKAVPSWTDKDIDGANGNLVSSGDGTWDLPASATAMLDDRMEYEIHVIAMRFTYDTDKVGKHRILVRIRRQPVGS